MVMLPDTSKPGDPICTYLYNYGRINIEYVNMSAADFFKSLGPCSNR